MFTGRRIAFVSCVLLQLLAIAIFLKGFFPVKVSSGVHAKLSNSKFDLIEQCQEHTAQDAAIPVNLDGTIPLGVDAPLRRTSEDSFVPRSIGRVVFVLIDALRADFVLPSSHLGAATEARRSVTDRMEYLHDLIQQNRSLGFLSKAHPPTVTLPRIKVIFIRFRAV